MDLVKKYLHVMVKRLLSLLYESFYPCSGQIVAFLSVII
uniref:Uncharacterized protein n=1 Tax=Rhizophora mucronata TaxID=61149 RepID=A0A2P2N7V8_RHIMU